MTVRCQLEIRAADGGFRVSARILEGAGPELPDRLLRACEPPRNHLPLPPAGEAARWCGEPEAELCDDLTGEGIEELRWRILADAAEPAEIEVFGRYLGATLLGPHLDTLLGAVGDGEELELLIDADPATSRLPWEMAYAGNRPLAALEDRKVAIARVVTPEEGAGDGGDVGPLPLPLKVLFVVGRQIDRTLRPGAELLGLLQRLRVPADPAMAEFRSAELAVTYLGEATWDELRGSVRELRPSVVHFVCHGELDFGDGSDGGCHLLLTPRQDPEDPTSAKSAEPYRCGPERLLDLLRDDDGRLPPVVVLNACHTADAADVDAADDRGERRAAEKDAYGSYAARLVAGGVAMAVGMSGRVADRACRAFTLRFYQALIAGESAALATAQGRRAALLEYGDGERSVEWIRPVLHLRAGLPAALGVTQPGRDLRRLADHYRKLRRPEVLCDRYDHLRVVDEIHRRAGGDRGTPLYAFAVRDSEGGVGKTRLLEEIAGRAVYRRFLPVPVLARDGFEPPADMLALALLLHDTLSEVRNGFGVAEKPWTALLELLFDTAELERPASPAQLTARMADLRKHLRERTPGELSVLPYRDFRNLFLGELGELLAEVEEATGEPHRALLLLDDLHRWAGVGGELVDEARADGLGTAELPLPVVFTYMATDPEGHLLRDKLRQRHDVATFELGCFTGEEERRLVYHQLLLSEWKLAPSPLPEKRQELANLFRMLHLKTRGRPREFQEDTVEALVELSRLNECLVRAEFEEILRRWR